MVSENDHEFYAICANDNSFDHFREIANLTDLDASHQTAGVLFSDTSTQATARRLHRSRQHLGSYRYDLVVAMRVVNSIEREMMNAEWENWLLDENTRCKQVQTLLRENRTSTSTSKKLKGGNSQQVLSARDKERNGKLEEMRSWHHEYCGSCKVEQEMMLKGRRNLAFG